MSRSKSANSKNCIVPLRIPSGNRWKSAILVLFVFETFLGTAQFPAFKDGETVCFVGNSITMSGKFYNYLELFYATRFPKRNIEFHNCGISGDVAGGVLNRMESDILVHDPDWVVLMLGMNDVGRSLYSPKAEEGAEQEKKRTDALERYYIRSDSIMRILLDAGTKVVLQTPSIYDQTADIPMQNNIGANDALKKCRDFLESTAKKYDLPIVDYWTPMVQINERLQEADPSATIIGSDRVHPGVMGHFLMTCVFLQSQRPSTLVSTCHIDAKGNKILKSEKCSIHGIEGDKDALTFNLYENALPFPELEKNFNLDSLLNFTHQFNRQNLMVQSLRKGNYALLIDNVPISNVTSKELRKGLNLSKYRNAPQTLQAQRVHDLFKLYWQLESRMRRIQYVEQKLLNVSLSDDSSDLNEMKRRFASKMEQVKGGSQSAINFYRRSFDAYIDDKPKQAEMKLQAMEIFRQITKEKTPIPHKISIVRH